MRSAGLRPTRQRVALADLLFAAGDRHVSAEALHEEAQNAGFSVSLATVYNTLHQFTDAGMLRIVQVEGARTYFDTNVSDHHHFFFEEDEKVFDIPSGGVEVRNFRSRRKERKSPMSISLSGCAASATEARFTVSLLRSLPDRLPRSVTGSPSPNGRRSPFRTSRHCMP
ncbi:ferric uptake regulator family protein [Nitratireductor aquibiodomus RA22]|uniref:Ferric uptake regulation protein n=1 Tax=Nitratireductor aquibiodomus RA22 TaxID=1189611 RepID=I5BSD0_9HYPH|nr:ferric uptake regulator family protein [Nitratireductor aquibiodomus RA22]